MTPEQALAFQAEAQEYFLGVPEAEKRFEDRKDEDGWLRGWLQRHPNYVDQYLGGQWPEWLYGA